MEGGEAYKHLTGVSERTAGGPLSLLWRDGRCGMRLWVPATAGEQIFTGVSPGNPPTECYGFVLRRRKEARTVFVSVFHPYRDEPQVSSVEFLADRLHVHLSDSTETFSILP